MAMVHDNRSFAKAPWQLHYPDPSPLVKEAAKAALTATPRTPGRTASKSVNKLNFNLLMKFKQRNSSSPRLSARLPSSPKGPLIDLNPTLQAERNVKDIRPKRNRASAPCELTPLSDETDLQLQEAVEEVFKWIPQDRRKRYMERYQNYLAWKTKQQALLADLTPRASDKALGAELQIEHRHLKISRKIEALRELRIPLTRDELKRLFIEISLKKEELVANKRFRYPVAFHVRSAEQNCFLEVHSNNRMLIRFLDHSDQRKYIDKGSFKTVYKAWCITQPKMLAWAISKLSQSPRAVRAAAANEEKFLTMFNHKTRVVKLIDAFYYPDNQQVLVMKYYPKTALDIINEHLGPPSLNNFTDLEKIDFAIDLMQTIQFIHAYKIVHRDIKPDNILYSSKGLALTDFGYACEAADKEELKKLLGSEHYVPYEVLSGKINSKGYGQDIWGAACVLWLLFAEKKYPWYDAVGEAIKKNCEDRYAEVIQRMINFHHHKIPPKDQAVSRLFWEMFHPHPDSRLKADQVLEHLYKLREMFEELLKLAKKSENFKDFGTRILPKCFSFFDKPAPDLTANKKGSKHSHRSQTRSSENSKDGKMKHTDKETAKLWGFKT